MRQFRVDDTSPWGDKFGTGIDGAYNPSTSTDSPIDSACTGTTGTTSLTATNAGFLAGQTILIHQSIGTRVGQWELNRIASYSAGTITCAYPLQNTYASGAQVLVMKQYSSFNIGAGVAITVKPYNGTTGGIYGAFCNGQATIAGSILGGAARGGQVGDSIGPTAINNGGGFRGGRGDSSPDAGAQAGEGTNGASTSIANTGGSGGGGGGGSFGGAGGGNGTTGSAGANGTTGGTTSGASDLTTLTFGGGGGGGGAGHGAGGGGNGGPIVLLIAKVLTVTGAITLPGANGQPPPSSGRAGGGGAGGSCLLKGQLVALGSNLITAAAGLAGAGNEGNGGNGGVGRIHVDYSASLSGSTSPTLDSRQDTYLADTGGLFLFNML